MQKDVCVESMIVEEIVKVRSEAFMKLMALGTGMDALAEKGWFFANTCLQHTDQVVYAGKVE